MDISSLVGIIVAFVALITGMILKGVGLDSVKYAAGRIDPEIKFTDDACQMLVKVPRPFLNTVLKGCVNWAKENNCTLITEKEMQIINDKRNKDKQKK